ncbi:hypothetical protein [Hydrogenophaga sp.]|uniref:hypothetical protein n=1 Tax=Hydrogenophaga sp. TaxID=1904254 RepID=UPI002FC607C2
MSPSHEPASLRMGVMAGRAVAVLSLAYAAILAIGLLTLPAPDQPIQNPWFTLLEVLILAIAPAMVALMAAFHAWAPAEGKAMAVLGIAFMGMCAVLTCSVHFAVLTLSPQPAFSTGDWPSLVFAFRWPSVAYALDILAWDVFFPLAAVCAAFSLRGAGLSALVRGLLFASAGFAFAGLAGVPLANMSVRNVGIIGYAVLFPFAAALSAVIFRRAMATASAPEVDRR